MLLCISERDAVALSPYQCIIGAADMVYKFTAQAKSNFSVLSFCTLACNHCGRRSAPGFWHPGFGRPRRGDCSLLAEQGEVVVAPAPAPTSVSTRPIPSASSPSV